jgi:serine/threonine protein kinase
MQVGQTIQGQKYTYYLRERLGLPGLYGIAFLATSMPTESFAQQEVVIKFLRSDAPNDAKKRLGEEAKTLLALEEAEKGGGHHYAVRLIDQSAASEHDPFIVMERARGRNVAEDLLDHQKIEAQDATYELLALRIMHSFANALRYVHQTGRLYLDMKLDNLFWDGDEAQGSLKIIDWNVVGETSAGVASDWARFGARLYQLLTGNYLEITKEGKASDRPSGAAWESLAYGVKTLINDALALRYNDDDTIYALLGRELEQAQIAFRGEWKPLLQLANQANSFKAAPNEVLASLWRAKQLLQQAPISIEKENALKELQALEQQAQERQGFANDNALKTAAQFLANGNISLARSQFERAYKATDSRDPRARRGIWHCLIAEEKQQVYPSAKEDLSKALEFLALPQANLDACRGRLDMVNDLLADSRTFRYLNYELELLQALQSSDLDRITASLEMQSTLSALLAQYPDLKTIFGQLEERSKELKLQEEQELRRKERERKLELAQKDIRTITLETSYVDQLQRYKNLHALLTEYHQPEEEHRRKEVEVLLAGLIKLKELEELENEARNVANSEGNWLAFKQRLNDTSFRPLANPLVEYGRWQERQGQWREQQAYWNEQQKRWESLEVHSSAQKAAIKTLQDELKEVQKTLEQHHTTLESLKQRLDGQDTLLHAVEGRLSKQSGLIDTITLNTSSLVDRQYSSPSDIQQVRETVGASIQLLHDAQNGVANKLEGLVEQARTISDTQAKQQSQPQTDIDSILTNQRAIDSIQSLIDKRLLSKAGEEAARIPVATIRSDFEEQITTQQLHAEEAFADYKAALAELDRDLEKPIGLYQNAVQLWLDNPSFYQEGNNLLSALSGFLDRQDLSSHSVLQSHGLAEYTQSIQALWRELQQAKRALVGSKDELVQSLDRLCDDVSNLFKAMIFLSGTREVSHQAKQQRLLKAKDELVKLRFMPKALVAKIDRVTVNQSKTSQSNGSYSRSS